MTLERSCPARCGLPRDWPNQETPFFWRRPRHRWTSSPTTPNGATCSKRPFMNTWEVRRMTTTPPRLREKPEATEPEEHRVRSAVAAASISLGRTFKADGANYFLLLGTTLFLVAFGIVMVLSSSSVDSYLASDSAFGGAGKQLMFAAVGVPLMLVA